MNLQEQKKIIQETKNSLIKFTRTAIQTKSFSNQEEALARIIQSTMLKLGYDSVEIDCIGNVIGKIGIGSKTLLFDSHMDTVQVTDTEKWIHNPFGGEIIDGYIYGRGSVDMKSGLAASIYAGAIAKQLGFCKDKTIYITCTVDEEFCDGESLKMFLTNYSLRPDAVVICEPSDNHISIGHKGKALIQITTHGVSAHGSAPEIGNNAIYEMAGIIQEIAALNQRISSPNGSHGTVTLSSIESNSVSLNAVPDRCNIYLDRRLAFGETEKTVSAELNSILSGKHATWSYCNLERTTWTGEKLYYKPVHNPWKIDSNNFLVSICNTAYSETFREKADSSYIFWDFSTNAVAPISLGIPTIGFGPGRYKLAHTTNEHCSVDQIYDAFRFYINLIKNF